AGQPAAKLGKGARRVAGGGIVRTLIYALLAAALLVPLLFGVGWFRDSIHVTEPAQGLADAVEALPDGAAVLVVFDYGPSTAAELELQARALMGHLLEKNARLIALSTAPEGPAMAQTAWDQVAKGKGYRYGEQFVNLGYLADATAGLRALAQGFDAAFKKDFVEQRELDDLPTMREVAKLSDADLAIVLAADAGSVQRWLEQAQSAYPIKTVAGVAASAGVEAMRYYPTHQLSGLLIGMTGAAEYEMATGRTATAVSSLAAQSLAHLAIILVIVLGNIAALITRVRQRK
ncbi:MAG: hypothetical protein GXY76_10795, partial [Chloroflexi bacterium]|nr:hypothetical protein [Chloroflexota bacterium]